MNISRSSQQTPDPEVSIKAIGETLPTLDTNRAVGYSQLGYVRSAKSASLAREQKLLGLKYGTAAHPRAQYAAAALPRNEQLRRELAATQEILEAQPPATDPNTFVVYGFVRRKNQRGIPGLTLALTDESGNWLRKYGYACTDKRGYFELRVQGRPAEEQSKTAEEIRKQAEQTILKQSTESATTQKSGESAEETEKKSGKIQTNLESLRAAQQRQSVEEALKRIIQLRVFNRDGRVLHVEKRPVVPRRDFADYRLIILDDDDCGCTPPPEKSDGKPTGDAPRAPAAPPAAPVESATPAGVPPAQVAALKTYQNPSPPQSQPLEAIRGIGPKTAERLRAAGIKDVAAFQKVEGKQLVQFAGFDKEQPKTRAAKPAESTSSVEKKEAAAKAGRTKAKATEKKAAPKSSEAKTKRPKK